MFSLDSVSYRSTDVGLLNKKNEDFIASKLNIRISIELDKI